MSSIQTPNWVKDAVFYQIFPDRFARSDRVPKATYLQPWGAPPTGHGYQGGDLLGVVEHLDYLAGLGINAIYFNPIFQSASNHRYHTHDYHQVDPMLGGKAALRELLDAAHARGIRVILDGVFNHASRGFFQFHDILENGPNSAYLDWFHVQEWPVRPYGGGKANYAAWWDNRALPKLNTDTPAVRQFIWDVARRWVEFGVDGWRLDVPNEIDDDEFWREFRRVVKAANPEAYIVGEIWGDAARWLQGDQFDAVTNYGISRAVLGFFASETMDREYRPGGFRLMPLRGRALAHNIERLLSLYPEAIIQAQFNLLDSHDTARFVNQAGGDWDALRLSLLFLMSLPGAPCVYYGTEIGMTGGPDPDCRRAFPWRDESSWNNELLDFTRRAIAMRKSCPALRRGRFETLYAHEDVVAFGRQAEGSTAVVAFNAGRERWPVTFAVDDYLPDGVLTDVWAGLPASSIARHDATTGPATSFRCRVRRRLIDRPSDRLLRGNQPMVITREVHVRTAGHTDVHDITSLVEAQVSDSGLRAGIATVFCPGSTGGLTTIEYESGVVTDLRDVLESIVPENGNYLHHRRWGDDNGSAHVRAALVGPSLTVPFVDGRLALGTWQQIVFLDFDTTPRARRLVVQVMGE